MGNMGMADLEYAEKILRMAEAEAGMSPRAPEPAREGERCGLWGCGRKASGKIIAVGFGRAIDLPPRNIDVCEYHFMMVEDASPAISISVACTRCGRDLHGYHGPLCRYCDGTAE